VTRAEALDWWRRGYEAGAAAAGRHDLREQEAAYRAAVAEWHEQHRASQQAAIKADLAALIHLIAQAVTARQPRTRRAHRPGRRVGGTPGPPRAVSPAGTCAP
jgi:hypothetical protein